MYAERRSRAQPLARLLISAALALGVGACGSESTEIRFSEIHYHPVLETDFADRHEFVEIYNAGSSAVDLSGWRMVGDSLSYQFPTGTRIAAGEYRVIAKERAQLAPVWGLDEATLLGDYDGELANGKDTLWLFDRDGAEMDALTYDDDAPWPVAADAMGASDDWLDLSVLPLSNHRYKGYSLERISFELPTSDPASWAASPLDGSTPGAANASAAEVPPAIVLDRDRTAGLAGGVDEVAVTFSPLGALDEVALEWFVDDVARTDEQPTRVAMDDRGERRFAAQLPSVGEGVVVRYRILANRGAGSEVISPRATDPYRWHAYAKTPTVASASRTYHLQIAPARWGQLWNNVQGGRDSGCTINPNWNNEVPAVLLFGDKVYDVLVRYQGSRYNRTNGTDLPTWPYPGPSAGPVRALSWHVNFPRYRKLEGRDTMILSKNRQGCPGYDAGVGFRLFRDAGVPAPTARYARLHINGGYYHYMLEVERPGSDMMAQYGPVGDLFKSIGGNADGAAYGIGDQRLLGPVCGLTPRQRYALTYDRKTHNSWGQPDPIINLITELHQARAAGVAAEREFFAKNFDLERLLDHMAIINWAVPFDDMFQNHYLYRRQDGKWLLMPWDLDLDFGVWKGANSSVYIGAQGDPDNRNGSWNYVKDSFLRAYRAEFNARIKQFVNGPLSPAIVNPKIDEWTAGASVGDAMAAPTGLACAGFPARAASWKQFVVDRAAAVRARVP